MGLVLRQIVVDEDRLRRVVEIVLGLLDLGDFRQLRDVKRAALEGEAVRPIEPRVERLDLAFSALVDDGVDLVEKPAADEHRALVPLPHRARIAHARRIDFDLESLRQLELVHRQLVGGGRNRRRRDGSKLCADRGIGPALSPRRRRSRWRSRRRGGLSRLLGECGYAQAQSDGAREQQRARIRNTGDHVVLP